MIESSLRLLAVILLLAGAATAQTPQTRTVDLPAVGPVTLSLRPLPIVTDETRLVVVRPDGSSEERQARPGEFGFQRGTVDGYPHSDAVLWDTPTLRGGRVSLGAGRASFDLQRMQDGTLVATPAGPQIPSGAGVPLCGTCNGPATAPDPSPTSTRGDSPGPTLRRQVLRVRVGVDGDDELRDLFDSSQEAIDYLVTLHAIIGGVFLRDLDVGLTLTFVRVWETPSPYTSLDPTNQVINEWRDNLADVPRDMAHVVSGRRDLPYNGLAVFIGGVCDEFLQYAWTGYMRGVATDAAGPYLHDVSLIAHELGHLLGAAHTHDAAIDDCPYDNASPRRGTIMSYCSLTWSGEWANNDLRFHRQIQERFIEPTLAERPCLVPDCNGNGIDDETDIADGTLADDNGDGIPDVCGDCDGNGVPDGEQILADPLADGNHNSVLDACEADCNGDGTPDAPDNDNDVNGNWILDACEPDCDGDGQSDLLKIDADMSLDLDRDAILDACEDCDANGVPDLEQISLANAVWVGDFRGSELIRHVWPIGTASGDAVYPLAGIWSPNDVLATRAGTILVSFNRSTRISEFDGDGTWLRDVVPSGTQPLLRPGAMALGPGDDLFVADTGNDRISRYRLSDGTLLQTYQSPLLTDPFGLAIGPDRRLYATSGDNNIIRFNITTGDASVFVDSETGGNLVDPRGIAFLRGGDLIVASFGSDRIIRYDGVNGLFVSRFDQTGALTLDQPWCLRIGPDGDVYVSRSRFDLPMETGPTRLGSPKIYHLDGETGALVRTFIQGRDSGLVTPTGFDFLPPGNDCNGNMRPDACDLADGFSADVNANDRPDECEPGACLLDIDNDGLIDTRDLLLYVRPWLERERGADVNADGTISIIDLLTWLDAWLRTDPAGLCP